MATVSVVRYQRKKKIGDDKSPMVYVLKPKPGESKLYSIESLAREIESIGSLSVEDVEHVMQSFVRSMKKVLVAGNKVKVDGLGILELKSPFSILKPVSLPSKEDLGPLTPWA